MKQNNAIYLTVRVDFEYDKNIEHGDAKVQAANRLTSFLSAASLYNEENGLQITDAEVCGENEE